MMHCEIDVLRKIAHGLAKKEIAATLAISGIRRRTNCRTHSQNSWWPHARKP
jgi:FixJ family two-component response regulator